MQQAVDLWRRVLRAAATRTAARRGLTTTYRLSQDARSQRHGKSSDELRCYWALPLSAIFIGGRRGGMTGPCPATARSGPPRPGLNAEHGHPASLGRRRDRPLWPTRTAPRSFPSTTSHAFSSATELPQAAEPGSRPALKGRPRSLVSSPLNGRVGRSDPCTPDSTGTPLTLAAWEDYCGQG